MTPAEIAREAMKIDGLTSRREVEWLADRSLDARYIVEIGCYKGRSTKALALAATEAAGRVWAVDTWLGSPDESSHAFENIDPRGAWLAFRRNLAAEIEHGVVEPCRMDSVEAAAYLEATGIGGKIDLLFVDGAHSYEWVSRDFAAWLPLMAPGGMVSGHDWTYPGVEQALGEYLSWATLRVGKLWAARWPGIKTGDSQQSGNSQKDTVQRLSRTSGSFGQVGLTSQAALNVASADQWPSAGEWLAATGMNRAAAAESVYDE